METLLLTGTLQPETGRQFARINYDHGDGHTPSVLVGHSAGVRFYKYTYVAPDRDGLAAYTIEDPEDSVTKTWAQYLEDFHGRRMADGEPFEVTDLKTGATATVVFVGNRLDWQARGRRVWGCEFPLRQYREADGS